MKSRFYLFFISFLLFAFQTNFSQRFPKFDENGRPTYLEGSITIKLKEISAKKGIVSDRTFGISSIDSKLSKYGVKTIGKRFKHRPIPKDSGLPDLSRIYKVEISEEADIEKIIEEISQDPNVEYVEPIPIYYVSAVPNDSLYSKQEHLKQIMAEEAWEVHKCEDGSEPVIIGICDTGVKWDHPDLIDNIWQNLGEDADKDGHVIEWADSVWILDPGDRNGIDDDGNGYADDFIGWNSMGEYGEDPSNPMDKFGHGTHVAGIVAATTDNGIGVAGVSWNAKIMTACQSSKKSPYAGYIENGYDGLIYLAESGADIINCSWGGGGYSRASEEAIEYARMLGSIVVCSAGNSSSRKLHYPSSYYNSFSVGGVTSEDLLHPGSNYGITVDVMAPYSIYSTYIGDSYLTLGGTSMSTPAVSGLLALIKSKYPELSNEELIARLMGTADNIDYLNKGNENLLGNGRANAYRALTEDTYVIRKEYKLLIDLNESFKKSKYCYAGMQKAIIPVVNNYSRVLNREKVTLELSSDDPDIEIIKGEISTVLLPRTQKNFDYNNCFVIEFKENVSYHQAKLRITAYSEIPVITEDFEFTIEVIPSSGIFVYEGEKGGNDNSGTLWYDFFVEQGLKVSYTSGSSFPTSLENFDAVFISCLGNGYFDADVLKEYLRKGGKLYLETDSRLTNFSKKKEILSLIGLEDVILEEEYTENPIDSLYGMDNSLAEGLLFRESYQEQNEDLPYLVPNILGKPVFSESNYGVVAVQSEGLCEQKTYTSLYSLAPLKDRDTNNCRIEYMRRVCKFLEIPIGFGVGFDSRRLKGKAPYKTKFSDLSVPDSGKQIVSWKWDFDNDNIIDSEEQFPEWTYTEAGNYTVNLVVSDGVNTKKRTREKYISVLGENTAVELSGNYGYFNSSFGFADTDSMFTSEGGTTIELWVKPNEREMVTEKEYLFDKIGFRGYINRKENSFSFKTYLNNYLLTTLTTSDSALVIGKWQHVAVTFDTLLSNLKIYINGIEQSLDTSGVASGILLDHSKYSIYFGATAFESDNYCGVIDEIRIWNTIRSKEEIVENMYKGLKGNEENLLLYLPLNEGEGEEISDYSINNYDVRFNDIDWGPGVPNFITPVKVEENNRELPTTYMLSQNYPNPFNPTTNINYAIPRDGHVTIRVYDVLGRKVATLVNRERKAGSYSVRFDARNLASGIYIYTIKSREFSLAKKMMLVK